MRLRYKSNIIGTNPVGIHPEVLVAEQTMHNETGPIFTGPRFVYFDLGDQRILKVEK